MIRPQIAKFTVVASLCVVALLVAKCFRPVTPAPVTNAIGAEADVQLSETNSPLSVEWIANTSPAPSYQAPLNPWSEKLATFVRGTNELFGEKAEERMKQLQDFVESLDEADLSNVLKKTDELQLQNPTAIGRDLRLRLLQRWADSDVHATAEWAAHMPAGHDRQEALARVAGIWAGHDLTEAITWARQLPDGPERQSVMESVADATIYIKPVDALNLAGTLPAGDSRNDIIVRATGVWASTDPENAVSWAKQIPGLELREQIVSAIAATWGNQDPVAAGSLAVNSLQPGPLQDTAVITIVERWGLLDASGVATWVNQFPEGPLRQTAIATLNQIANHIYPGAQSSNR